MVDEVENKQIISFIFFLHFHKNILDEKNDRWHGKFSSDFLDKMGKPRGLRTARKLKDHRREQRWHDKDYKKSHLGSRWKSNPFAGASHAKGIVLEKV